MKILQLCLKPPIPAKDGGCIAMNNITQGLLAAGHSVKILTIYTQKHDFLLEELPEDYIEKTQIEGVYVDTALNVVDAFANFMTADSYNISRFFSTDYDIKLSYILQKEKFDIIHLESLFMTPYVATIRRYGNRTPIVLRSHNLEYVIWEKIATGTKNIVKRTYLNYLAKKLREYELRLLNEVNGIAAISEEDRKRFLSLGVRKKSVTIPFGINLSEYGDNIQKKESELALFHLGAMDWGPNLEGILWFLDEIWPKIHQRFPELKMYLAGRNMSKEIFQFKHKNVELVGEVDDAIDFIQSKSIMVVPLLSAGGIRVKIIEGLALGKCIISTTLGAEGINCTHEKNIMLADTPDEWLIAIEKLMTEKKRNELSVFGKQHVHDHFDNTSITKNLVAFYQELISA